MSYLFLALVFFLATPFAFSQKDLHELLIGKTTLNEIMPVVDQYYNNHPPENNGEPEFESEWLHWKRWEWYMSGRLGHGGEFVNISEKLIEGLHEKENMPHSHDRNINSGWTFVGPSASTVLNDTAYFNGLGRVDRIVFHPTNPNIIFICTPGGGLWSTLNDGSSWNNLTDNLPSLGISGFVISYTNTSIMYLLTGDGDSWYPNSGLVALGYPRSCIGVLKSTDGGISWHATGAFPNVSGPYTGYQLVQSPNDPNILLAATSNGVYRTSDGGGTWSRRLSSPTYDVDFKPGDGTRAYATQKGDIWLSTDSGNFWSSNSTYDVNPNTCGSNNGGRMQIGVSPNNPNLVYLLAGPVTSDGHFCGVWLSSNSGSSFTRQSNTPNVLGSKDDGSGNADQSYYDIAIAVRPAEANSLVVAGCTIWKSTTSGASWNHVTSYNETGSSPYIHPDVHDMEFSPLTGWLYAATDGGFFESKDFGTTWINRTAGIETSLIYHMAGWDGNINKLLCGMQDNGIKYRKTNSSTFYHISCCDGFDVVFNPDTGQPAFVTANDREVKIYNDGQGDQEMNIPLYDFWFKTLAIHNSNPDTILCGSASIYKTTDGGDHWVNKGADAAWALTSCPSNSNRFYCAGGQTFGNGAGQLYFSNDIGETWTSKSGNSGFPSSSNWVKITDVTVRPTNSSTVWACFGGFDAGYKVVTSNNTGDTWTNMSANLPNVPVNCLAIDNDNGVYAGTDIGVFYRSPTMTQWMPWSNGIPNTPVTELVIYDDGTTKRIRAATFGRGVWQSDLAATCDAAVVVTGGLEGIRHYEASNSISSTAFIQGGIGTFVSYQSGNYITLSDGFNVVDDSEFLGFISPCGQGGIPSLQENEHGINRSDPNSSIILLRRMWDKEDGLPYGSIDQLDVVNHQALIKFRIKKSGRVQLYAAREVQDQLETLWSGEMNAGSKEINVDISNLSFEFYYILLFVDGKLAHFQEMDMGIKNLSK